MDTDQSGRLDFQEFSAAVAVLRGEREQRLYDTLLEKMQIDPAKDLTLQEVHAAVEVALKGPVTREMLVEWLTKVAKRSHWDLYNAPVAGMVSNADFRRLFGQSRV